MKFFLFFFLFNGPLLCMATEKQNGSLEEDTCNIQNLVEIQRDLDDLKEEKIVNFLRNFDGKCSNNVEYSEFSNEVLFSLLLYKKTTLLLIKVLSENNKLPIENIRQVIENPINDQIDIKKVFDNVKSVKSCQKIKDMILESIKIAMSNM